MSDTDDRVGLELAGLVREQYARYVAFHSDVYDAEADALTLWTMHTHVLGAADTTPYIYVTAPTPEAGKSRIIDVAQLLVATPHVVVDPTPASLFRLIDAEHPTVFIDEADELHTNKPLRALMNAGYRRGGYVPRSRGSYMVKYDVYCPKLVAGIKGRRLPLKGATLSRCIEVPMRTRLTDGREPIEEFHEKDARRATEGLARSLAEWGAEAIAAGDLAEARPPLPGWLSDRQRDGWQPLAAIADRIGGDWDVRARAAAHALRPARRPDEGTQLIADLYSAWEWLQDFYATNGKPLEGTTADWGEVDRAWTQTLIFVMQGLEDRQYEGHLTPRLLAGWLGRFDVRPAKSPFHCGGRAKKRGYERAAFADAFDRYVRGALEDPEKARAAE